jgi:membrane protein
MGGRAKAVQEWLARRGDTPIVRLALRWFHRYFEASQNSGSAATIYLFLSVGPLLLAASGLFHAAGGNTNVFAQRLIEHHDLTGETANLVRQTFGTASHNALAASVGAVIGFLVWGIGIGQIYQDVYAHAWHIRVRTLSDQARFTIWFFVLSGLLGLFIVAAGSLKKSGWAAVVPAYLLVSTAFWLWTPRYLLHKKIALRALLPGALLATLLIGGATAVSPLFLGPWLNSDGKYFGSFGVVIALLTWGFILTTISMTCAAFSPVWAEWRENETHPPQAPAEPQGGVVAAESRFKPGR